jgi:hypothetical protein
MRRRKCDRIFVRKILLEFEELEKVETIWLSAIAYAASGDIRSATLPNCASAPHKKTGKSTGSIPHPVCYPASCNSGKVNNSLPESKGKGKRRLKKTSDVMFSGRLRQSQIGRDKWENLICKFLCRWFVFVLIMTPPQDQSIDRPACGSGRCFGPIAESSCSNQVCSKSCVDS